MRIYLWLYEECSVFNLVLVIKDQGYALTIDYIKKKQKITDSGVSSYSETSFYFYNTIFSLSAWPGRLFDQVFGNNSLLKKEEG